MSKELEAFTALGSHFLMKSKHYINNDVEIITKTGEKYSPQELAGIVVEALKDYEKLKERAKLDSFECLLRIESILPRGKELLIPVARQLKAFETIKELFDFDFAIRFGDNQPMIKITNKRNGQYWERPISLEKFNLLKKELWR